MLKKLAIKFLVRWVASSLGLWIAAAILGPSHLSVGDSWGAVIGAGFILALVNMAIKPLLIILSFPAIILSLGLFMLIINGLTILIADWIYGPLQVSSLGWAVVAGLILGLVNFLISRIMDARK